MISKIKELIIFFYSILRSSQESRCIFYHDIHDKRMFTNMSTAVDLFEQHILEIRKQGFEIVTQITKPHKQIAISFDDAWAGIYYNIHIINRLEVPITLFVVPSFIGKKNYLTQEQLLFLNQNPNIHIQSHGFSHKELANLDENNLKIELSLAKKTLEDWLQRTVSCLCYPKGIFNNRVINMAREVGYVHQYCSLPGSFFNEIAFGVKRRSLVQFVSVKQLRYILRGGDEILNLWYKSKHFKP